jgi:hypothetical protein
LPARQCQILAGGEIKNYKSMDEEIKKLLEENLKLTQEIYKMTKKIREYITFQKIVSFIYLFLIVAPIILGILYLPPLLKNVYSQYSELLGGDGGGINIQGFLNGGQAPAETNSNTLDLKNIDLNKLPLELQKYLKK